MTCLDYRTIDLDKITYGIPKKYKGRYTGEVLYKNKIIKITTPYLRCMGPITISENRCYLELELDTDDKDLYEFFADLDDIIRTEAYQKSKSWFGNQFPLDVIDDFYNKFMRYPNKLRRPYIKVNIPYDRNSGISLENFSLDDFKANTLVSAVLKYDGLRFFKQHFTSEWSLESYEIEEQYEFKENSSTEENDVYNGTNEESENLTINGTTKIEENIEQTVEENIEQTVEENIEQTIEENIEETIEKKVEEIIEKKVEEDVEEIIEKKVEESKEKGMEEDVEKGVNKLEEKLEETGVEEDVENEVDKLEVKKEKVGKSVRKKSRPKIIKYAHRNRIWN